ncbi:glycosyltransferase family 1 protein [Coraliomargarita sinensis]|uniref:Glycosyltransferase family 1 protein n=1 Tax=Coraliomargarita sinensis TaxID=2174842 RepID=A0A317ZH94_9BACT|nr:glycosyltransferase [Coraliomargarita sinensis]PXA03677.1 glycosyltransferase family 1 protein [Coraliomargarita sinensis]
MKILFIGGSRINARLRVRALEKLGHSVDFYEHDTITPFSEVFLLRLFRFRLAGIVDRLSAFCLKRKLRFQGPYDVVFLNQSRLLGPRSYRILREHTEKIVNYINDDPFGNCSVSYWRLLLDALPSCDLVAVSRGENVREAKELGAQHVLRVFFPADEKLHSPMELSEGDVEKWSSDVLFIGTCFPERGPFMSRLIELGVPLTIYGNGWEKSPEWHNLRHVVKGGAIYGKDYVKVIQCAKVAIGLLSKGNRDTSTRRSMEIPAIGTVLCAERTDEHLSLYKEGKEALFFDNADECANRCLSVLKDPIVLKEIGCAGRRRFLKNGTTNLEMMKKILAAV